MQIEKNRLDAAEIVTVSIQPEHPVEKYSEARKLADEEEAGRLNNDYMLMSWYDKGPQF